MLIDFNAAAEQQTGSNVASLLGKSASALYPDQPHVREALETTAVTRVPLHRDLAYRFLSTGTQRRLRATFIPSGPNLVLVVTEDFTRQRSADAALGESNARYETLVEEAPDGIVVHREGRIVYANRAFFSMMRATSDSQIIGRVVLDLVHPDDRDTVRERLATLPGGRRAPLLRERLLRADGTVLYADIAGIRTTYNGAPAVQAIVRDVTDRHRMEALYSALTDQGIAGVMVIQDDRVVYANDKCGEFFGDAADALIGRSPYDLVLERSRARLQHMLKGPFEIGASIQYTVAVARPDGREAEIEVYGKVIELDGKPALVGTMLDATERERMAQQLRQAQKMEAVGQLAGGVAHDFNNVLTAIRAYAEFALQDLDEMSPSRRDVLEIRAAADRAAALTHQLLAFSRRQTLQAQPLHVNAIVEGLTHMLRRVIEPRIEVHLDLADGLPRVLADEHQLEQVILNLCVNARDAMPDGGTLTLSTWRKTVDGEMSRHNRGLKPGDYVGIAVRDTGSGMTPDVAARVFEPFFTTKPAGLGTGLGLAVVYGIVKQSGGYITLDSEPGKGTSFTVLLPALAED